MICHWLLIWYKISPLFGKCMTLMIIQQSGFNQWDCSLKILISNLLQKNIHKHPWLKHQNFDILSFYEYSIRIDTKSISEYFSNNGRSRKSIPTQEKTPTVKRVLCFSHFNNVVLITSKDLNNIPITSKYKDTSAKQIQKRYFKVKHPGTHHMQKGRSMKLPIWKSKDTNNK